MKKILRKAILAGFALCALHSSYAATPTEIYGVFGWTGFSKTSGVYKFTADNPTEVTEVYTNATIGSNYVYQTGGAFVNSKFIFYYKGYSSTTLYSWSYTDIDDNTTWSKNDNVTGLPITTGHTALAVYQPTGDIYGCFYNADGKTFYFGKLNVADNTTEKICELEKMAYSLAISDIGAVYWVDIDGILHKGSIAGGFNDQVQLEVAPYKSSTIYTVGSAIDPIDGTLYLSLRNNTSGDQNYYFCTVDPETGALTKTDTGSDNRMANVLYIKPAAPAEEAPEAISDIQITAENFSTTLDVAFDVPSKTVSGTSLNGTVKVYVAVNGKIVVDGETAQTGSKFSKQISVADGACTIAAYVVADDDDSLKSNVTAKNYFAGQDTPESVKDLKAEKTDAGVVLTWTAPEIGVSGGEFDKSQLAYTVAILANDKGEAGETLETALKDCTYTYQLDSDDLRILTFEVTPHAGTVTGKGVTTDEIVVGEDFPGAVANLSAQGADKVITITWEAPAEGLNKGEYDKEGITYNVILLPDTELAKGQKTTSFQYTVDSDVITTYKFAVTAVTKKGEGPATETAGITFGSYYEVPFTENFDGKTLEETLFTIVDVNEDNSKWAMNVQTMGTLGYKYNMNNKADDWAISAPIKLQKNVNYVFNYDVILSKPNWGNEKLSVCIGNQASVDAMTQTIAPEKEYSTSKTTEELTFSVEDDGTYYIGFHVTSDSNKGYIEIDNLSLDFAVTAVPAPAEDLTVSLSATGGVVSFTVPTTDAEGGNNPRIKSAKVTLDNTQTLKTFTADDLEPGEKATAIFNGDFAEGVHTVSVVITNAAGDSEAAEKKVRVGDPTNVPAAADELKAELQNGVVTLTFTVPTTDAGGEPLPKITSATVYHNENPIHTFNDIEEGAVITHTHSDLENSNIYAVTFTNAKGESDKTYSEEIKTTGIDGVAANEGRFSLNGNSLFANGCEISVYNITGALVGVARDGQSLTLPAGIYILKADGFATKIVIR